MTGPTFSTRTQSKVTCTAPVLTIGFPKGGPVGPNSVVLANGAVVDLVELGRILQQFCPALAAMPSTITTATATPVTTTTTTAAPVTTVTQATQLQDLINLLQQNMMA